jgi:hypothetical protein
MQIVVCFIKDSEKEVHIHTTESGQELEEEKYDNTIKAN